MKAATYVSAFIADDGSTMPYSCEITTSDTPQEAFKRTLAKGYATSATLHFSEDIRASMDNITAIKSLVAQAIIAAGAVDKIVRTGDVFYDAQSLTLYVNTPTRISLTTEDGEFFAWSIGARDCIESSISMDDVYNRTKYNTPKSWILYKVECENQTYDSRQPYYDMTNDQLRCIISEDKLVINKIDWDDYEALAALIEKDPIFIDEALKKSRECRRCESVLDMRNSALIAASRRHFCRSIN